MKATSKDRIKTWELALLCALSISLVTALWAHNAQAQTASRLIRLHIIAESDAPGDQAVKLEVRNAVLKYLEPRLESIESVSEAQELIKNELPALRLTAQKTLALSGHTPTAGAELSVESYPTRYYDGFALPAGEYLSLRITLGEGEGRNWWCVVFPPLCLESAEAQQAFAELDEDTRGLILSEDGGYRLKFRIIEIYELLRGYFTK